MSCQISIHKDGESHAHKLGGNPLDSIRSNMGHSSNALSSHNNNVHKDHTPNASYLF